MSDSPINIEAIKLLLESLVKKRLQQLDEEHKSVTHLHAMIVPELEQGLIEAVMEHCQHNQLQAANVLGINRNTLRSRLKKYNLK